MKPLFAPALERGDTIAVVAPAGVLDRARIELAVERLEQMGFRIKLYRDIYRSRGYLAGDDATRAAELRDAFADPEVSAIFPARGGSGVIRLLDLLDYSAVRNHPKILTGFSDITALHLALQSQTGLVTFHSPNLMDGLGMPEGLTNLSARTFWQAVLAESYLDSEQSVYEVLTNDSERQELTTLVGGVARGRLVGGNLALVCSLQGTPFEIETAGNILLLEDVGEQPYRIDRFLSQLHLAGKLNVLSGVVLGQFTQCVPSPDKPSLSLAEIFSDHLTDLGIPVVQNFPTGHTPDNATLPLGVTIELDADNKTLTILERPVSLTQ
jgi:muramoyltetrapeptide carboxypeptidase